MGLSGVQYIVRAVLGPLQAVAGVQAKQQPGISWTLEGSDSLTPRFERVEPIRNDEFEWIQPF